MRALIILSLTFFATLGSARVHELSWRYLEVVLLITAVVCQMLGIATVAVNYYRTSVVASKIAGASKGNLLVAWNEKAKFDLVVARLGAKWYLTIGLCLFAIGAVAALFAGLVDIFHWQVKI